MDNLAAIEYNAPTMTYYRTFFEENWSLLQQASLFRPRANPTFDNPTFAGAKFRVLIVRLSPFKDVERSTPHLFLFQSARRAIPDAYVDMAFFPPQHDRARFLAAGIPLLIGGQSWRSMEDFDVVLVSNAYTLELINLPYALHQAGIPLLASARDDAWPPVLLGGSNALATQAIVTEGGDCVADAIFFGEGEREVARLLRVLHNHAADSKPDRLACAAEEVAGLWVANSAPGATVEKAVCAEPDADDLLTTYPLLNGPEAGTARLQINFGCPAFCSFCFEGYDRKPYRELTVDAIDTAASQLKRTLGPKAVDLYSFNFNTHQDILELLLTLNRRFDRVSFKSQRLDVLAAMPSLLEAEVIADKHSYTLGVEGVSSRMRAFLHKSLSDVEIGVVLDRLFKQQVRELKLFYILTGHETSEDVAAFRAFVADLKALRQQNRGPRGHMPRVIFSFGLLIRMPFTPLRYDCLFLDEDEWRAVIGPIKSACETHGFEFRLATPWDEYATTQVLALGGYWLIEPVLKLAAQGYCYDGALVHDDVPSGSGAVAPPYWERLREWMLGHGKWDAAFLDEKDPDARFALDFVRQRIPDTFLYRKYRQALEGVDEGYCLGELGQMHLGEGTPHCLGCAACSTPSERAAITGHVMRYPGPGYVQKLGALMRDKRRLKPIYGRVWLPPLVAGVDPAWCEAWVLRALFQRYPMLEASLLSVEEALFTAKPMRQRFAGLFGETVFAFKAWDTAALSVIEAGALITGAADGDVPHFLGWVEDFEVGTARRMELAIALPSVHFPNAGRRLRQFFQDAYVPVNVRREGSGYRFDISAKARKKRVIFDGDYAENGEVFHAHLLVSPKFDLLGYLRSFPGPDRAHEAQVEVVSLVL